jgi:hypothetical protein
MTASVKTPWHLWAVGGLALLWNAGGAYDYVMTNLKDPAYLSMLSESQRAYVEAYPGWAVFFWALGVWGAVGGSVLLLLRSRFAVWAFAISLVGMGVSFAYQFFLSGGAASMGPGELAFVGALVTVGVALLWYARLMQSRGVLR